MSTKILVTHLTVLNKKWDCKNTVPNLVYANENEKTYCYIDYWLVVFDCCVD